MTNRLTAVFLAAISFVVAPITWAQSDEPVTISIEESQPLSDALQSFADQTDLQVIFFADITEGKDAPALEGEFTADAALDTLLADTGLSYTFIDDTAVSVQATATSEGGASDSGNLTPTPVLMAQSQTTSQANRTNPRVNQDSNSESDGEEEERFEEIIVVGSQIRGVGAAGADVITLDREYIEEGGFATTADILRSVPQNLGGLGTDESNTGADFASGQNIAFSSAANLRGLGTENTLSLVNGRRTAPGGNTGGHTDLNFIPASAIEHVEVLADGASAIYGSDAIAGVVNVTLRDDYEGAETRVRYGPGTSDIEEFQFSQAFGVNWESGNVMFTYEYFDRGELKSVDRAYARDSDLTMLGGTDYRRPFSNPGNIIQYTAADGSRINTTLAIPSGQDGTGLTPADLSPGTTNLQNLREGSWLLPSQERHSALLMLSQELSSAIELSAEVRYSTREFEHRSASTEFGNTFTVPSSNAFFVDLDPQGGSTSLLTRYSFIDDFGQPRTSGEVETLGATLSTTIDLSHSWELEVYGSISTDDTLLTGDRRPNTALLALALADDDPATAFNLFGDGSNTNPVTIAAIEGFLQTELESELITLNVRADGELFELPGGTGKLAIGGEFRDQSLKRMGTAFLATLEPVLSTNIAATFDLERDVAAAFAEVYLPIVSKQNERPGIRKLTVSLAGRYENYSDFGDTLNPKIGVSWSPTDTLTVRGTAGTSFRAPFLTQLDDSQPASVLFNLVDPASPTNVSAVLWRVGNSAELQPEEGTTWTAGIDVMPESLPGFRVGLTYFETELDRKIAPAVTFAIRDEVLLDPDAYAPVISRVPRDVDRESVAALIASCFNCGASTADDIDVVIDGRLNNLIKSDISGLDLKIAYAFETDFGRFNTSVYASHLLSFEEQALLNGPLIDQLDTMQTPNSLRLRGGLSVNRGGFHIATFGNYIKDYTSEIGPCSLEACRVGSWTTWDLNLGYDFDERHSGFLQGTRASLNIRNVFDRDPPFVEVGLTGLGYNPVNSDPFGQHLTFQVSKQW